jgi:hypothetical protein
MDLTSLKMLNSTVVEIFHPETLEPIGLKITLASPESEKVKAMRNERTNRRLSAMQKGSKKATFTVEEMEAETVAILVAATQSWELAGDASLWGERPECTAENVKRLYTTPGLEWIRKQVDEAFGDQGRFFQK